MLRSLDGAHPVRLHSSGETTAYLILHGRDAPLIEWLTVVASRFDLPPGRTRILYDEHERMIAGDPEAVERVLGVDLGLRGIETAL